MCVFHGSAYANLNFDNVLDQLVGFLKNNPTQLVLMRLSKQDDGRTKGNFPIGTEMMKYLDRRRQRQFAFNGDGIDSNNPVISKYRGKFIFFISGGSGDGFTNSLERLDFGPGDKWTYNNLR